MKIVLATKNNHKIREIEALFKDTNIQFLSLKDFPNAPDIVEDADTFEGNALKKARAVSEWTKEIAMADDSGLQVEVLNNKPGVYSSRYAGEDAADEENYKKLLNVMEDIPFEKRGARYKCVIAVVFPDGNEKIAEGECKGFIAFEPKGKNGFGYDPVFYLPEYDKTMAEISPEEKNKISHRAKAIENIKKENLTLGGMDMKPYRLHVFVSQGKHCVAKGSEEILKKLREKLDEHNLKNEIKTSKGGCLSVCKETEPHGELCPAIVIYPEGVWYKNVHVNDIDEIIEKHLKKGQIVERLLHYKM